MLIMAINLYGKQYDTFGLRLRYSGFQAASILTTTGFVIADYAAWPLFSRVVLFILMFIGGCSGSTGGGIKVIRIATMFKLALTEMKYLANPRGIFSIKLNKQTLKQDAIYSITGFSGISLKNCLMLKARPTAGSFYPNTYKRMECQIRCPSKGWNNKALTIMRRMLLNKEEFRHIKTALYEKKRLKYEKE
jgi:hypothetical protein